MIYRVLIDDYDLGLRLMLGLRATDPGLASVLHDLQARWRRETVRRLRGVNSLGAVMKRHGLSSPQVCQSARPLLFHRARLGKGQGTAWPPRRSGPATSSRSFGASSRSARRSCIGMSFSSRCCPRRAKTIDRRKALIAEFHLERRRTFLAGGSPIIPCHSLNSRHAGKAAEVATTCAIMLAIIGAAIRIIWRMCFLPALLFIIGANCSIIGAIYCIIGANCSIIGANCAIWSPPPSNWACAGAEAKANVANTASGQVSLVRMRIATVLFGSDYVSPRPGSIDDIARADCDGHHIFHRLRVAEAAMMPP